jgi:hypothetical protein
MLEHTLAELLSAPMHHSKFDCACDIDAQCRLELARSPHPPTHIFGDIEDFWLPGVKSEIEASRSAKLPLPLSAFVDLAKSRKATRNSAWCTQCNQVCKFIRSTIVQGSPPCIDHSPMHKDRKMSDGDSMSAAAAFFAMRLAIQEPVLWIEESDQWNHADTCAFL